MKNYSNFIENFEKKQKKAKKRKKVFIVLLSFIFFFVLLFSYYNYVVKTIVTDFTKSTIDKIVINSINTSVSEFLREDETNLRDLVVSNKDNNNNIVSLTVDTKLFNQISSSIAIRTDEKLNQNCKPGILIPIGTLSGIYFLNGKGTSLSFSCSPIGNVECEINSLFESAGINQTIHKLYIDIFARISVALPVKSVEISNKVSFLAVETIVVGDVPLVFIN